MQFEDRSLSLQRGLPVVNSYRDQQDDDLSVSSSSRSSSSDGAGDLERLTPVQDVRVNIDGSIQVDNSTGVTIGNTTHYHSSYIIRSCVQCDANGHAAPLRDAAFLPSILNNDPRHPEAARVDVSAKGKTAKTTGPAAVVLPTRSRCCLNMSLAAASVITTVAVALLCFWPLEHKDSRVIDANNTILPLEECGRYMGEMVYGGNEAALRDHRWLAVLMYRNSKGRIYPSCSGAIINKRYVLTAAHCVKDTSIEFVRLGEHDLSQNPDCDNVLNYCSVDVLDITVEEVILHPGYRKENVNPYHDIALIRLSREVEVSNNPWLRAICLPAPSETAERSYVGKQPWLAGWGRTGPTQNEYQSTTKQLARVLVVSDAACNVKTDINATIQLCTSSGTGASPCRADDGAPLMLQDDTGPGSPQFVVVGVLSIAADSCGRPNSHAVYVRVAAYTPWILQNIRN